MIKPIFEISPQILARISEIEAHRADIRNAVLLPEREAELHYRATVEAAHSSTSIEGNPLNDRQVAAVLGNKSEETLTRHAYAEIEVRNYKRALDFVDKRKRRKDPISAEDILRIHEILMAGLLPEEKVGKFRRGAIYIVDHREKLVYTGAEAGEVKKEVGEVLEWVKEADLHPCIVAAVLHIWLMAIHPFADGNGRSTRLATLLYLGLAEYDCGGSLVLDNFYSEDRVRYYAALQAAHSDKYEKIRKIDLTGWIEYFAEGFLSSVQVLCATVQILSVSAKTVAEVRRMPLDKTDILSYVAQFGSITLSEAEAVLAGVSRRSVQRKLRELVDEGYLKKEGGARSTKYIAA